VDSDVPTAALSVAAVYADGTRKNVTDAASYFSLDPAVARVELQGRGVVTGMAAGTARIRAVYTDPAFKRGFAATVPVTVKDILGASTLDSVKLDCGKLTMVAGDSYQLAATGAYTRGGDHFTRPCATQAEWTCGLWAGGPAARSSGPVFPVAELLPDHCSHPLGREDWP
jgi:hypothetical protein